MWNTALAHITTSILDADFGTLDKVKHHSERNKAASEAAQTYVNALAMVVKEASRGWNGPTALTLQSLGLIKS